MRLKRRMMKVVSICLVLVFCLVEVGYGYVGKYKALFLGNLSTELNENAITDTYNKLKIERRLDSEKSTFEKLLFQELERIKNVLENDLTPPTLNHQIENFESFLASHWNRRVDLFALAFSELNQLLIPLGYLVSNYEIIENVSGRQLHIYHIEDSRVKDTSEGEIVAYFVRRLQKPLRKAIIKEVSGWRDFFDYVVINRDDIDHHLLEEDAYFKYYPSIAPVDLKTKLHYFQERIFLDTLHGKPINERRTIRENQILLHEIEHERRHRILQKIGIEKEKGESDSYITNPQAEDLGEQIVELKSIIDSDNDSAWIIVEKIISAALNNYKFAVSILRKLANDKSDHDDFYYWMFAAYETDQHGINELKKRAQIAYNQAEGAWEKKYGLKGSKETYVIYYKAA